MILNCGIIINGMIIIITTMITVVLSIALFIMLIFVIKSSIMNLILLYFLRKTNYYPITTKLEKRFTFDFLERSDFDKNWVLLRIYISIGESVNQTIGINI